MNILKEELIDFQIVHLDPVGDVYEYKGKIIRIINRPFSNYVNRLMQSGLIDRLVREKFLVETCISDNVFEEGNMVLEHRKIAPQQAYSQWTFSMMKDAARLVLEINMICWEYGYELKDCHQANILFDGVRPVYVDFGSIVKHDKRSKRGWIARESFLKCYYYPLKLWSKGFENMIEALMKSSGNLNLKELLRINYAVPSVFLYDVRQTESKLPKREAVVEMKGLLKKINKLHYSGNTKWAGYQDSYWGNNNKRFDYEIEWINERLDIETMIEIGANQGWFSYLVATKTNLTRIISTDYDKGAVDIMYRRLKEEKRHDNRITPLLLDFVWMPIEQLKKLCCDLVVANALTHHLILTQGMSMKAVVERLAVLSNKYVIVEFMENGIYKRKSALPKWYTLDNFVKSMEDRFSDINVHQIEKGRTMIVGTKKE